MRPNKFRFGTKVGAGIAAASAFSSFFRGVVFRSFTLERRTNLPVPRLTLLHIPLLGLSFSSSCAGSLVTWPCRLLLEICLSIREVFRDAASRLPGDGILRREEAADAVLTPEGWIIGGVKLGVAGVLGWFRGKRVVRAAVWGVVIVRFGGVVVPPELAEVFATSALTFWTVGVASADTLNGGKLDGSNDWRVIMVVREDSRGVWALELIYEGIEVLSVSPWSRDLRLKIGGVLGILWEGSGGGGDL